MVKGRAYWGGAPEYSNEGSRRERVGNRAVHRKRLKSERENEKSSGKKSESREGVTVLPGWSVLLLLPSFGMLGENCYQFASIILIGWLVCPI